MLNLLHNEEISLFPNMTSPLTSHTQTNEIRRYDENPQFAGNVLPRVPKCEG